MDIREYIESGILEAYVLGSASDAEAKELLFYKERYPEVESALFELEIDLEQVAERMAITPPPGLWSKIEADIQELIVMPEFDKIKRSGEDNRYNGNHYQGAPRSNGFIEVESESSHMRIHKNWKWVFAAVFVLGKIFLGCAIYFYLENRQAQQQIEELKTEMHQKHLPN